MENQLQNIEHGIQRDSIEQTSLELQRRSRLIQLVASIIAIVLVVVIAYVILSVGWYLTNH